VEGSGITVGPLRSKAEKPELAAVWAIRRLSIAKLDPSVGGDELELVETERIANVSNAKVLGATME
jgi:hypothetical protein